jgi:hypothetical protein
MTTSTTDEYCATCGTQISYAKKYKKLMNGEFVCRWNCAKEYALNYFDLNKDQFKKTPNNKIKAT